jgi:hypothetical protein
MTRGISLHGMRAAASEIWGDAGLVAIADRLSLEARGATVDDIVLPVSWYPTRFIGEWVHAVWEGPAGQVDESMCAFMERGVELGFGRMRRFFLRLASLELMAARAPDMWRYEHTHGTFAAELRPDRRGVILSVRDHPFVRDPLTRRTESAVYRHILELSGLRDVRETHAAEGQDTLVVRVTWGA